MDPKDPPPFGYTFEADFFGRSPTTIFANSGPPLLSENENQSLIDFFAQDPFLSEPTPFPTHVDAKSGVEDTSWTFAPPPNVHHVSTTLPDQSQLHRAFHADHAFAPEALSTGHLTNTQDDLQAASTLFNNAHSLRASQSNSTSYSVPSVPSMHGMPPSSIEPGFHNLPLVTTPHGMMNEQLAALLPSHSDNGSIEAQLAAHFSQAQQQQHHAQQQRTQLKRPYTYGTDSAFNSSGYVAPNPHAEEAITQRLIHDLRTDQALTRQAPSNADGQPPSPTGHITFPVGLVEIPSEGEAHTEDESSEDDEDGYGPAKKRRKSKATSARVERASMARRKSASAARSGKNRKASVDEQNGKKKRPSSAGQKGQRENLSEEQKRSNHILSEQKRRNLIKRGFDDLHDLVPEIRNGGLSKSSVLMEAAAFLEKIIEDNKQYLSISGTANG